MCNLNNMIRNYKTEQIYIAAISLSKSIVDSTFSFLK